ncbi:MAG: formate/nitrite transporter family protein [Desulfosarcinaceae bacterium]
MHEPKEKETHNGLNHTEMKDARRRAAPTAAVVYEAIRREGEEELNRSTSALVWSGLAAGLSMGFSFLMDALLNQHIPEADWRPLITKLGYCMGFLIVVLGRQQLFTENTLTPILQLLNQRDRYTLLQVARLWSTVLGANLAGALVFALLMHAVAYFQPQLAASMASLGEKVYASPFGGTLLSALFAGWLIALMVWLLPFAETGRVTIIILITYVVGLGGFAHIIAGSVNALFALLSGDASFSAFCLYFLLPTLMGNIVGGVAFVAAINHAQVEPRRHRV